jgi:DNA-3-methyladenine glycosylase I
MSSLIEPCRCPWLNLSKPDYVAYHDQEWGVPVHDDALLFEYLVLESAQAGLSWYTILQKREGYRQAFDQFNAEKIASYDQAKVEGLMQNPTIIRNRLKILSTISNAQQFLKIQQDYVSFDQFIWQFVDYKIKHNQFSSLADYPARTAESDAMSLALKRRGFKFVGSTTCYAFMQAVGMVNDHSIHCFRRTALAKP